MCHAQKKNIFLGASSADIECFVVEDVISIIGEWCLYFFLHNMCLQEHLW